MKPAKNSYHPSLARRILSITLSSLLCATSISEAGLKIYYIRHAEGGHNVKRDWEKSGKPKSEWPDYVGDPNQFTPLGKTQLAKVSAKLQELEYRFDFIASSPAWRSYNTIWPYMKDVSATAEIWPELKELSVRGEYLFQDDLPEITKPVLGAGPPILLTDEESKWFSILPGSENEFEIPDQYKDDSPEEVAAAKIVYQTAIDRMIDRFGGTDKAILLAGHGASGKNIIRLLTKNEDFDSIDNTGIWMVEQQPDGSFKLMIYNSEFVETSKDGRTTIKFNDLRADLSDGEINGIHHSHPDATITKVDDGLDTIYSLSLANQDFDGVDGSNDSLSWNIRFKGFTRSSITGDYKNKPSVELGTPSKAYSTDAYFGVSDKRYVDEGDSIQFSVENILLNAAPGTTVEFHGFDRIYGSDDHYIFGVGQNRETQFTDDDDDFGITPVKTLTLTCPDDKFRVSDLSGSFTISSDRAGFHKSWISKPDAKTGTAYSETLQGTTYGNSLTFSKVDGPSWLTISPTGALSGTPNKDNTGTNIFKVKVTNPTGSSDTMKLIIPVQN